MSLLEGVQKVCSPSVTPFRKIFTAVQHVLIRDQSILLFFSPIFLSSNSFLPAHYAQY